MKVEEPFTLINGIISKFDLKVPEFIMKLEYYEDKDGGILTAFFSQENAIDTEPVSPNVILGLSKNDDPVFLEIHLE